MAVGGRLCGRGGFRFGGEVAADFLPGGATVGGPGDKLRDVVEGAGVARGKSQRSFPGDVIVGRRNEKSGNLSRGAIHAEDYAVPTDGIDVVGIEGIGGDKAALERAGGKPVAISDDAVVATMRNADRARVLLRSIEAIREAAIERDSIELP